MLTSIMRPFDGGSFRPSSGASLRSLVVLAGALHSAAALQSEAAPAFLGGGVDTAEDMAIDTRPLLRKRRVLPTFPEAQEKLDELKLAEKSGEWQVGKAARISNDGIGTFVTNRRRHIMRSIKNDRSRIYYTPSRI